MSRLRGCLLNNSEYSLSIAVLVGLARHTLLPPRRPIRDLAVQEMKQRKPRMKHFDDATREGKPHRRHDSLRPSVLIHFLARMGSTGTTVSLPSKTNNAGTATLGVQVTGRGEMARCVDQAVT